VASVDYCEVCDANLEQVACTHERRTKIDIVFEKVVEHVDAEIKQCLACQRTVKGKLPVDMPARCSMVLPLGSSQPDSWIFATMKYCQDNDSMLFCAKINAVRKTMGDGASNVLANKSKLERMFRCQRYATVNLGHKFKRKSQAVFPHSLDCLIMIYLFRIN
jgi:hypothetical protein